MDFFLVDPNVKRLPPAETRLTDLHAEPYPDGHRLRVNLQITPFQKRPHIEITLTNGAGDEVASTSIVEPLSWNLEFTMHLRGQLHNPYTLHARLYYPEGPSPQPQTYTFEVTPPAPDSN